MSREKGKRGERAWAEFLRAHGYEARRGVQYQGGPESPDVVCPDLHGIHWEVKAVESLNIWKALEQARTEARDGWTPVVAHKRNRSEWLVTLPAAAFMEFLRLGKPVGAKSPQEKPHA